jgi:hypothetical protein
VDDDIDEPIPTVPKPDELLALHDVTTELFQTLRRWFAVPPSVAIDLREIDSAVGELGDPLMIAALAMRKLQALHLLSTPGVMTTTDVVITIVQDLDRALIQAPNMHLKLLAAATDWDAAFEELNLEDSDDRSDIADADDDGPETDAVAGRDAALAPELTSPADDPASSRHDHPARRADLDAPAFEILDPSQADPATERFRLLHGKLHDAAYAVIELSEGEIRYLI